LNQQSTTWIWSAAIAGIALAAGLAAEIHGRSSRHPALLPPEAQGGRWATVGDAAASYRVWETTGARGRRLVVLTGRWSKPRNLRDDPPSEEEMRTGKDLLVHGMVDVNGALYAATLAGIARRLDVVMPPAAYQQRRAEVSGQGDLELQDGAFRLPYESVERRFSKPDAFRAPAETVLVLVEPSWFQEGAPESVPYWLASRGVFFDLALIALSDPVATEAERVRARRLGESMSAPFLETE
jgi:hypothetical protein